MKLTVSLDASPAVRKLAREVERNCVGVFPTSPTRLVSYPSTDLPNPADYPFAMVWLSDLLTIAASDGAYWYPYTKGTHL